MLRTSTPALLLLLAACISANSLPPTGVGTGPGGPGSPGDAGGPGSGDGGSVDGGTAGFCGTGCAVSMGCGASQPGSCALLCASDTTLSDCLYSAQSSCQANALCWLQWEARAYCDAGVGAPSGSQGCQQTAACEGLCVDRNCVCNCRQALNPQAANFLWNLDSCGESLCVTYCGNPAPGCGTCKNNYCSMQANVCLQN